MTWVCWRWFCLMDSQWEIHQKWGIYSEYIYICEGPLKRIQDDGRKFGIGWRELDRHRDLMRRNLGPKWHDRDGNAIKTSSFGRLEITMANGSWSGSRHASLLAARQPTAGVELSFSSSDQMAIQLKKMLIKHHIWVNYLIFRQNPF